MAGNSSRSGQQELSFVVLFSGSRDDSAAEVHPIRQAASIFMEPAYTRRLLLTPIITAFSSSCRQREFKCALLEPVRHFASFDNHVGCDC